MRTPTIKTWTRSKFEKFLKRKNLKALESLPEYIFNDQKFKVQCLVCGNRRDRMNNGPYRLALENLQRCGCSKCNKSQRPQIGEILKKSEFLKIKINSKIPTNYSSKTKVQVSCSKIIDSEICGNAFAKNGKDKWTVNLGQIYYGKAGCSKCSRNQSITSNRFKKFCVQKHLQAKYRSGNQAKDLIKFRCTKCKAEFLQSWDRINQNLRPCNCRKSTWYTFEKFIQKAFGGKKKIVNDKIVDCFCAIENTIIECKYGTQSLLPNRNKVSLARQAQAYIKSGYRVVYLVNCPKEKVKGRLYSGIEYYFLEDFPRLKIGNQRLSKKQIELCRDMYLNPQKYSDTGTKNEYSKVRDEISDIVQANDFIFPSSKKLEILSGYSWQKIIDAFGMPQNKKSSSEIIIKHIQSRFATKVMNENDIEKIFRRAAFKIYLEHVVDAKVVCCEETLKHTYWSVKIKKNDEIFRIREDRWFDFERKNLLNR